MLCRVLQVARAGYYAWRQRSPSRHAAQDAWLKEAIGEIHATSRGTYGTPRIHATLARRGVHIGPKRVARLLAKLGVSGQRRPRRVHTTARHPLLG